MFMDCHLMVTNPMDYVDEFIKAGASGFTFHVEVAKGWLSIFMFFYIIIEGWDS
jgi:pentose-5-phosphate-3-epimerase